MNTNKNKTKKSALSYCFVLFVFIRVHSWPNFVSICGQAFIFEALHQVFKNSRQQLGCMKSIHAKNAVVPLIQRQAVHHPVEFPDVMDVQFGVIELRRES